MLFERFFNENSMKGLNMATRKQQTFDNDDPTLIGDHITDPATHLPVNFRMPDEDDEVDDVTDLANVLNELGEENDSNGFVTVFKEIVEGAKRDDVYTGKFPVSEFSLDDLKAKYGAGKYTIRVYRGGGKGLAKRKVIRIAADPVTATPAAQSTGVDTAAMLQAMQQGFKEMAGMMATAMATVAQRPPEPSRAEFLREMLTMKELFANPVPAAPASNPLEALRLGIELAREGAGGGESNPKWLEKAIDTFGQPLMTMLSQQPVAPAIPPKLAPTHPTPVSVPTHAALPAAAQTEESPMNIMMNAYFKMTLNAAIDNKSADEWADYTLSLIPPGEVGELENLLNAPEWFETVNRHIPQAVTHRAWFDQLRAALLQFIAEDKGLTGSGVTISLPGHENVDDKQPGSSDPASSQGGAGGHTPDA